MATSKRNPYGLALESFILSLKREEDIRSPFYSEVLSQVYFTKEPAAQATGSAEKLSSFIKELNDKQKNGSITRRIVDRLEPLISGLSQYTAACDVMIQAAPSAAMLLYGGARIVLILAEKFKKCFEDVLSMMEEVGHLLKCYHVFSSAYEASLDMQGLLVETYKHIVSFWQKAAKLFSKKAYKTLLTGIVKPLDAEWQRCRQLLQEDARRVQMLAQATEADIRRKKEEEKATTQQTKLRNEIVDWIKGGCQEEEKLDVRQDIRINLAKRHDNTCDWIFTHPEVQNWLAAKRSTSIWYTAPPGAGKTITSSAVVRYLQDKGQKTATFFCSFNDLVRREAITAFRSIALQLLGLSNNSVPEKVRKEYEDDLAHYCAKLKDFKVVVDIVEALMKQQSRVHIIIDGLDEVEGTEKMLLLNGLLHLVHVKTYGIVKFFFTSRPDSHIRGLMRKNGVVEIESSHDSLVGDVRNYVTSRVLSRLEHNCEPCIEYWTSRSEGNFLWVQHMMDILDGEGMTCDDEISEELEKFPKGLTGCYTKSLATLSVRPERHRQLARLIFTMVVGATQPMRLSEFQHALAATKGMLDFSQGSLPKPELIEELCSNLIVFDRTSKGTHNDPLLKVAHKSVQDFFVQDPDTLDLPDKSLKQYFVSYAHANLELGQAALSYLSYQRYNEPQDIPTLLKHEDHAFLRHAAVFWHHYLDKTEHTRDLSERVVRFAQSQAFWTCTAVQSRVAPYLFGRYKRSFGGYNLEATGPTNKNEKSAEEVVYAVALPGWLDLDEYGSDGPRIVEAFHNFVTEWHPVLNSHPEAGYHCIMDSAWEEHLPGKESWRNTRAKFRTLTDTEASFISVVDMRVDSELVLCHDDLSLQYYTRRTQISNTVDNASLHSQTADIQPFCAPVSPNSYIFSSAGKLDEKYWSLDLSRLTAQHHDYRSSEHPDTKLYLPERATGKWAVINTVTSGFYDTPPTHCAASFHCIRDRTPNNETFSSQSSQESGYASMDSVDSNSDLDTDDDASISGDAPIQHCMLIVRDTGCPSWLFWESKQDMEASIAFHPHEPLAVLSRSAHDLSIIDLNGKTQSAILPEPVDTQFLSISTMKKEFRFSADGKTLYYLLYTSTETDTGFRHTVSLTSFLFCNSQDPECVLERTHPTKSVSYENTRPIQHPFILTYWSSEFVYIVMPSLSCNPKIVRLQLHGRSHNASASASAVHTLTESTYFPYSTPYRSPQLKVLPRKPGKEILIVALDAEFSSDSRPGKIEMRKPPAVMAWNLRSSKDWREWDEKIDAKEKGVEENESTYQLLRGNFLDKDRRFDVPVRSGLDWKRKAFLSCA
ncbi:hypothetical protein BDV95DRAFT_22417 [Massariosphaeria phaeospora]|uniref:Uncharacterized protein n=1 Tax=Massariosphaeria phaeospora TaxID=100035 RepID=A0A7C8IK37_9PLEO|nr:hypothetical protein BDV95DRAFT_22417 [Massariosphaeria phaeospora]